MQMYADDQQLSGSFVAADADLACSLQAVLEYSTNHWLSLNIIKAKLLLYDRATKVSKSRI